MPLILELASCELVAIMGFVAGLQGLPILWTLAFFVPAWLLFLVRFPLAGQPERRLAAALKARFS